MNWNIWFNSDIEIPNVYFDCGIFRRQRRHTFLFKHVSAKVGPKIIPPGRMNIISICQLLDEIFPISLHYQAKPKHYPKTIINRLISLHVAVHNNINVEQKCNCCLSSKNVYGFDGIQGGPNISAPLFFGLFDPPEHHNISYRKCHQEH